MGILSSNKPMVSALQGTCNNITFGNERYQYYETICGGAGARPEFDGAPGLTGRNAVQRADGCVEELGGCAQTE